MVFVVAASSGAAVLVGRMTGAVACF